MATFAEIKARVEKIIIDLPATVQAETGTFVNAALKRIQRKHNFKVMETVGGPYVTATGTRVLTAVPANYKEARGRPYRVSELGQVSPMFSVLDRSAATSGFNIGSLDRGGPVLVLDAEPDDGGVRNFEVYPLPDGVGMWGDGQYRIYIPYWRFLPALAGAGDTNWFTTQAEEYLIKQGAAEGFLYDWDEERGALWSARADKEYDEVVLANKRLLLAGVDTLVPLWEGANQPRVRL